MRSCEEHYRVEGIRVSSDAANAPQLLLPYRGALQGEPASCFYIVSKGELNASFIASTGEEVREALACLRARCDEAARAEAGDQRPARSLLLARALTSPRTTTCRRTRTLSQMRRRERLAPRVELHVCADTSTLCFLGDCARSRSAFRESNRGRGHTSGHSLAVACFRACLGLSVQL
eukprot:6199042-Pleurochrysis_carterae.AAC.2